MYVCLFGFFCMHALQMRCEGFGSPREVRFDLIKALMLEESAYIIAWLLISFGKLIGKGSWCENAVYIPRVWSFHSLYEPGEGNLKSTLEFCSRR